MEIDGKLHSSPDEVGDFSQLATRAVPLNTLGAFIFYGLVTLMALLAIPYGTVEPWWEGVFECAAFFFGLLWVIEGFLSGSWTVRDARVFYPLIALIAFAILQSIPLWQMDVAGKKVWYTISADGFESWRFALKTAALVMVGLLLTRYTRLRLSFLAHAIIGLAVACALFGVMRQAMQHSPGFLLPLLRPDVGYAQFINKNHFAYLMEMGIGIAAGVAMKRGQWHERAPIYSAALLLMFSALILCGSRGGRLALVAQVVCAPLLLINVGDGKQEGQSRWRTIAIEIVVIVALLAVIVGGAIWIGGDRLASTENTVSSELARTDLSEMHEGVRRRDIWSASWKMFRAHPFLGAGFGGYWIEVSRFHDASGSLAPQQAHNDYLEVLASGGLVGVCLLAWFVVAVIKQGSKALRSTTGSQQAAVTGVIIALVGVGVHSLVDFGLHITINAIVFMALLAILSLSPLSSSTTQMEVSSS